MAVKGLYYKGKYVQNLFKLSFYICGAKNDLIKILNISSVGSSSLSVALRVIFTFFRKGWFLKKRDLSTQM